MNEEQDAFIISREYRAKEYHTRLRTIEYREWRARVMSRLLKTPGHSEVVNKYPLLHS